MCECIEKLKERVTNLTGDPDPTGPFETSMTINFETSQSGVVKVAYLKGRTKKRDGTLTKAAKKVPVTLKYCPFCGEKY